MKRHRRLIAALGLLVLLLATRSPGAGLFWILCGALLLAAAWQVPDAVLHRSRQLQWEAALDRAAEGWPTRQDRVLLLRDRLYRGTAATAGMFFVLFGLVRL